MCRFLGVDLKLGDDLFKLTLSRHADELRLSFALFFRVRNEAVKQRFTDLKERPKNKWVHGQNIMKNLYVTEDGAAEENPQPREPLFDEFVPAYQEVAVGYALTPVIVR